MTPNSSPSFSNNNVRSQARDQSRQGQSQGSSTSLLSAPNTQARLPASASATMSTMPVNRERDRSTPQTVPEHAALPLTRSQSNVVVRPSTSGGGGSGSGRTGGGGGGLSAPSRSSPRRPSSSQGVRRSNSTAAVGHSLTVPSTPSTPHPPPPSQPHSATVPTLTSTDTSSSSNSNNCSTAATTTAIINSNPNANSNSAQQYRFLPRIITNALNSRRSEDFGSNVVRTPTGKNGTAVGGQSIIIIV